MVAGEIIKDMSINASCWHKCLNPTAASALIDIQRGFSLFTLYTLILERTQNPWRLVMLGRHVIASGFNLKWINLKPFVCSYFSNWSSLLQGTPQTGPSFLATMMTSHWLDYHIQDIHGPMGWRSELTFFVPLQGKIHCQRRGSAFSVNIVKRWS